MLSLNTGNVLQLYLTTYCYSLLLLDYALLYVSLLSPLPLSLPFSLPSTSKQTEFVCQLIDQPTVLCSILKGVSWCDSLVELTMFFFPHIDVYDVAKIYYLHRLSANTLPHLFISLVIYKHYIITRQTEACTNSVHWEHNTEAAHSEGFLPVVMV